MHKRLIPVWFFVGLVLTIYGVLICASGMAEWSDPSRTVLAGVHASAWWGGLLAVVGGIYSYVFRPKR